MANPTSNFGWQMPTATDLVTDLPADFEVFGQAVDTDFVDLLGGTTGQILSKTSATDLDFTWINNDQGDITGVTATTPLTGGGTSGAITVGIQDALTTQKGAVQLSDSTSTTSSILAATPTAVKAAYDLADGAIAKTTVTTAGDIIYRNATVPVRLGIGTAGQVLTVNSGATAPQWTTPAGGGGKVLQVVSATTTTEVTNATSTFADTTLTATITPTLNTSKILVLVSQNGCWKDSSNTALIMKLLRGSTSLGFLAGLAGYTGTALSMVFNAVTASYLDSPATTSATTYKTTFSSQANSSRAGVQVTGIGGEASMSMITLLEIGA